MSSKSFPLFPDNLIMEVMLNYPDYCVMLVGDTIEFKGSEVDNSKDRPLSNILNN